MVDWIPYVIGYGFAIAAGHLAIRSLVDRLWLSIGEDEAHWRQRPGWWLPGIVGLVERSLYVGSINLGFPEFIGVWLALKVVLQWYAWKKGIKVKDRDLSPNCIFSIFLIGNGMSIGYAFAGSYLISEWKKSMAASIAVMLVILGATVCLWLMAKNGGKHEENTKKDVA